MYEIRYISPDELIPTQPLGCTLKTNVQVFGRKLRLDGFREECAVRVVYHEGYYYIDNGHYSAGSTVG